MARIPMTEGFTRVSEGTHIFRIYEVEYDVNFGKIVVHMITAQGITHREYFSLMKKDGTMNEGACNAFSFFAKTALDNFDLEEIDHTDLINHYIKADVAHSVEESTKEPGKMVTYVRTSNYATAKAFDTQAVEKALTIGTTSASTPKATAPTPTQVENKASSLASILG